MKRYILRFYRSFFSKKGRKEIKKLVYLLISCWILCFIIQWLSYAEQIKGEWYFFYFIYCSLFYLGIMFLPWTRYTLLSKLRIFQIFSFASVFVFIATVQSLYCFFILNQKPFTAYTVYQVALHVLYNVFS